MGGSIKPKADYDLMAIMYSTYGIHDIAEQTSIFVERVEGNLFNS